MWSSRLARARSSSCIPRKERKRIETEWSERIRRARRRVETAALDLALQVVALWYADLACLAWGAGDLIRNVDRWTGARVRLGPWIRSACGLRSTPWRTRACAFSSTYRRTLHANRSRIAWSGCSRHDATGRRGVPAARRVQDAPRRRPPRRVYLRSPERSDRGEFVALMRASRAFHRPWATAPTDDEAFDAYLVDSRRPDFEAMLVCRREDRAILGFFNLSHITRGSLQSAYLGYAVGQHLRPPGLHARGDRARPARGLRDLRLHRIEANIQPGNHASIALARGAGFSREGFSPRYLKIGGRWRDHERWAILAEDWRARAEKLGLPTLP